MPSKSAPQQKDMSLPKDAGFRLPRIIAELCSARPVHLAIIDGVKTATGAETNYGSPNRPQAAVNPGVLIAGTNCVATDAVAMAVMGFDPMADRGAPPFANSDSMLHLAKTWESACATSAGTRSSGPPSRRSYSATRPSARRFWLRRRRPEPKLQSAGGPASVRPACSQKSSEESREAIMRSLTSCPSLMVSRS